MFYVKEGERLKKVPFPKENPLPKNTVWLDMLNLTKLEETSVEDFLGISLPTREEMHEIELSSSLYHENDAVYMTATIVTNADTLEPESHAFTFILTGERLITIRYCDPVPFQQFSAKAITLSSQEQSAQALFAGLLESIVERIADILEKIGRDIDQMTQTIFRSSHHTQGKKRDYQKILEQIGREGDLVSKTRESLVTINRMVGYALQSKTAKIKGETHSKLDSLLRDVIALSDHANFLSNKVGFLLDATLGMINIEQNAIIKIFSVAAVVFLPPTLIASIYGMNFDTMPELRWSVGYPFAIALMIVSAIIPYLYFKRKKWL
jgi:magnesium transporter